MNNTSLSAFPDPDVQLNRTKIIMYSVVLVWSLVSNVLVIMVILKNKHLRNNFNYLIINMAVSDLIVPCVGLPMMIASVNLRPKEWLVSGSFGSLLCKLAHYVADISPVVSGFSLVIIAANRYMAIAYPMKRNLTQSRTIILNCATWIMACLLLCPYFYTYRLDTSYGWIICTHSWTPAFNDETAEVIFIVIVITVVFVIPGVTNTSLYSLMLYKLRQNSKNVALMLNNEQTRRRQNKDKNIFVMTISVMISYLCLWGPFYCAVFVLTFTVKDNSINSDTVETVITVVQFLGFLHSAVNPCVYFIFLQNLRQGLMKLFCHKELLRDESKYRNHSLLFRLSTLSPVLSIKRKRSSKSSSV